MKVVALSSVGAVLLGLITPSLAAPTASPSAIEARKGPFRIIVTDPYTQTLLPVFLQCNGKTTSIRKDSGSYSFGTGSTLRCTDPISVGPANPPPIGFPENGGVFTSYAGKDGFFSEFSIGSDYTVNFANEKIGKASWISRWNSVAGTTVYGYFGGPTTADYINVILTASFDAITTA